MILIGTLIPTLFYLSCKNDDSCRSQDDCYLELNELVLNRLKKNGAKLIWISKLPETRLVI